MSPCEVAMLVLNDMLNLKSDTKIYDKRRVPKKLLFIVLILFMFLL